MVDFEDNLKLRISYSVLPKDKGPYPFNAGFLFDVVLGWSKLL